MRGSSPAGDIATCGSTAANGVKLQGSSSASTAQSEVDIERCPALCWGSSFVSNFPRHNQQATARVVCDVGARSLPGVCGTMLRGVPSIRAAWIFMMCGSLSERTVQSGADFERRLASPADGMTLSEVMYCSSSGRTVCTQGGHDGTCDSSPACDIVLRGSLSAYKVVTRGQGSMALRVTKKTLLSAAANLYKSNVGVFLAVKVAQSGMCGSSLALDITT